MKLVVNTIKMFFSKDIKTPLGRWSLTSGDAKERCEKKIEVMVKQANMDNCGDTVCGIPKYEKHIYSQK